MVQVVVVYFFFFSPASARSLQVFASQLIISFAPTFFLLGADYHAMNDPEKNAQPPLAEEDFEYSDDDESL